MTAIAPRETSEATNAAACSISRFASDADPAAFVIATALPGPATASTYARGSVAMRAMVATCAERTATGPIGRIDHTHLESTAEAIMEVRRRSGLTWEELGELFEVSRRSVHHWANGKPVSARNDRMIRRILAAVRHLDRGDRARTRALLLTVDDATGVSTFDLLRDGRFYEARGRVESVPFLDLQSIPLSEAVRDARRPQAPTLLLEAEQERPDIPATARTVRPKRISKSSG